MHPGCIRERARAAGMKILNLQLNLSFRAASAMGLNFLPQFCEPGVWIDTSPGSRQAIQVGGAPWWLGEATANPIWREEKPEVTQSVGRSNRRLPTLRGEHSGQTILYCGAVLCLMGDSAAYCLLKVPLQSRHLKMSPRGKNCHPLKATDWDPQKLAYSNCGAMYRTIMYQMIKEAKAGIEKNSKATRDYQKLQAEA